MFKVSLGKLRPTGVRSGEIDACLGGKQLLNFTRPQLFGHPF
jgi:hypothetical protein